MDIQWLERRYAPFSGSRLRSHVVVEVGISRIERG
jgi:hypothetical protein